MLARRKASMALYLEHRQRQHQQHRVASSWQVRVAARHRQQTRRVMTLSASGSRSGAVAKIGKISGLGINNDVARNGVMAFNGKQHQNGKIA
jgi:hypothetical protein